MAARRGFADARGGAPFQDIESRPYGSFDFRLCRIDVDFDAPVSSRIEVNLARVDADGLGSVYLDVLRAVGQRLDLLLGEACISRRHPRNGVHFAFEKSVTRA